MITDEIKKLLVDIIDSIDSIDEHLDFERNLDVYLKKIKPKEEQLNEKLKLLEKQCVKF